MRRKWLLFPFCLVLLFLLTPMSRASLTLRVNESATRVVFAAEGTHVLLEIENSLGRQVDAQVQIELVGTDGAIRARTETTNQIKSGAAALNLPIDLKLTGKSASETRDVLWYRLRYRIKPGTNNSFDPITGVISLAAIAPDIFALHIAAPEKIQEGAAFRLRVRAAQPLTARAVGGVELTAELKFDGYDRDDVVMKQIARTDANGFATIDFQIPRDLEDDNGEIKVTGRLGVLTESAEADVDINRNAQVMVSTDKPLYQPGQVLHTRVLMFDSNRRALADQKATLKVSDPESTTVIRSELIASRFGVASADWTIPENTRLGDYRIEIELEGDKYESSYGAATVKISRYDLPNFTVNVKPDHTFYLPEQNADVEVRADYLFGQPVKHGHVRVVRETERHWNYREQKYETEEGDKYEGEADAGGRFIAHINLSEEHAELHEEDYARFRDLSYAAYFTDATTNRTEQRRFDLRLTKNAIHIYTVARNSRQTRDFPLEFYLSTTYADGTPAVCEVAISQVREATDARPEVALRTVRTNKYGLAKVSALTLPKNQEADSGVSLMMRAGDGKGSSGQHAETISFDDQPVVRIATDKPLYRDGDPVRVQINGSQPDLALTLDVIDEHKALQSQLVQLHNGRASIVIPYRKDFTGPLTLAAYAPSPNDRDGLISTAHTILYPHDRDLKFKLALNQESYRPGEEGSASFLTSNATGRAMESALGIVIFDKAVEERARTDQESGVGYGFYRSYCYLTNCSGDIGGITRKDLDQIDLAKPLPEGLDLVAEVLLDDYDFVPKFFDSETINRNPASAFSDFIKDQMAPLKDQLESQYLTDCVYPNDLEAMQRSAAAAGIAFADLRDPWESPYRLSFFAAGASDVFELTSAGPDKRFETADDFAVLRIERPYFRFTGEAINRANKRYHARTGRFIRDAAMLNNELKLEGIDFVSLRDPWGRPYEADFGVSQTNFLVWVRSSGPDKKFSSRDSDDVLLWTSSINYSADLQARIDAALVAYFKATGQIPQTEAEYKETLSRAGVIPDSLLDPWGRPYYVTFKQTAVYGNRVTIFSYATYGQQTKEKTELTPVTQQISYIYLRSVGEDGKEGTPDDFNVASFSRVVTEQAGNERSPQSANPTLILPGSTGAITGTVTDPNGASVAGATITAKNKRTSIEYTSKSDDSGAYMVRNLPAGLYDLRIDAAGFSSFVFIDVSVRSSNLTRADASLNVAAATATVTVTASAIEMTMSSSSTVVNGQRSVRSLVNLAPGVAAPQLATPRLREYFPETLVWQPSLETDKQGRAQLKFKLADNITTWKMSVIGSTEDGQIGTVEKEIKSFQPFFVEHDPPRILTEGDEISLPVVVRNYLDRAQAVNLEIKPESWFALLGPPTRSVNVAAGDAGRGTFDFRASASVKDGKQRITATGADANDAIEKPVTVHPDGEEKSVTASDVVGESSVLTLNLPNSLIPNSVRAELKIYPNLMAHVAESVEAIMERPYGCGEQTISSTYPSLLLLRNNKKTGQDSPLRARAERYLHAGYDRLLNYRDSSGGFTYWGHGDPDLALTAYALRFLSEAKELIAVDDETVSRARAWLIKQQRADGSWAAYDYGQKIEDKRRTALLTAYIARVLAMTGPLSKIDGSSSAKQQPFKTISSELRRALDYLGARVDEIDEPYLIASYALAALDAEDRDRGQKAIEKLRALAHEEDGASYWSLETNTPFYGWGLAGRVETTALVVQALARYESGTGSGDELVRHQDKLINRGLLFLLRSKDRYGVWYSTQATINVLDSLLVLLARDVVTSSTQATPVAEILTNGRSVKTVKLPAASRMSTPITIDLNGFVHGGANMVEIKLQGGNSPASAQAVATYYLPWPESLATQNQNWRANGSSGLRLITKFDKTEGQVGDPISCHVEAERIGFSGYGMMLAEIGLPPGADVDRASLDAAMKGSDWSISQYDILPDRVVVYLWPRAGGTKFDFKFRPRFGLRAQTAASVVYDYYNPEARAIVAPVKFLVK